MMQPSKQRALAVLDQEVEARCRDLAATRPTWPCQRGCDHCCRHLAEPPRLVAAEWRRLEQGLARLDPPTRDLVEARLAEAAQHRHGSLICPFLDREAGACRVYEERPVMCRSYGFYQHRDGGAFCHLVEQHAGEMADLVWGSQDAINRRLERLGGKPMTLGQWLESRDQAVPSGR